MLHIFKGSVPLSTVSPDAIVNLYMKKNIFVPFNTRCCKNHLDDCGYVHDAETTNIIIIKKQVKLTGETLSKLLQHTIKRDGSTSTLFNQFEIFSKASP